MHNGTASQINQSINQSNDYPSIHSLLFALQIKITMCGKIWESGSWECTEVFVVAVAMQTEIAFTCRVFYYLSILLFRYGIFLDLEHK